MKDIKGMKKAAGGMYPKVFRGTKVETKITITKNTEKSGSGKRSS